MHNICATGRPSCVVWFLCMEIKNIIYGLRDPRNDVYYYIGKSTVGTSRPLTHLIKSHSDAVNEWVSELKSNYIIPVIDIIEEIQSIDGLAEREKYWIEYYYSINPYLLNVQLVPKETEKTSSDEIDKELRSLILVIDKIPEILRRERILRNMTQTDISKITGINRTTISLVENGTGISLTTIKKYVHAILCAGRTNSVRRQRARKKQNKKI